MKPTESDIACWKAYMELVDKYEQRHGDEYHALAQNWAIKELSRLIGASVETLKSKIDKVCDWLMEGVAK